MTGIRTAAVLGLGLIGGSLARNLAAVGVRVLGWDRDASALRDAVAAGVVEPLRDDQPVDAAILAVPVHAAPAVLRRFLPALREARLVTDAGSTKRGIVAAAEALGLGERFVGSHPLAGDHRSGWSASRRGLFAGARVYLTTSSSTAPDAMRLARSFWEAVGAHPRTMTPDAHDHLLAWSSHLPQAVSSALAIALARAGVSPGALGPGGRAVTRLAGSSPEMWAQISTDNADRLGPALAALEDVLRELRSRIESGEAGDVEAWFAEGRAWE